MTNNQNIKPTIFEFEIYLPALPCGEACRGLILFLRGTPQKLLYVSSISELGWQAKTRLEEGIRKTYKWYTRILNYYKEISYAI